MKKQRWILLALAALVLITGCKKKQPETEAPTEPPTEMQTEAPTEPPTTEPPTEPEPEDSMNKTRSLKGLVKEADADKLKIQTERGKELEFTITGADIQLTGGITAGASVTILYKGAINGDDTSNAKVQMIVDLGEGETPVTEGEPMTEAEFGDPEAGAGTLGGTIDDISTDRIVILADDGESYYFSLYEASVNLVNGTQQGNYVTVDYNGDIYGPDLVPATNITDNDPANGEATVQPGPSADGGPYEYVSGVIEEYGVNTVAITTDAGNYLSFDTTDATQYYETGIAYGAYITIEYTGELDDTDTTGVSVSAVYEYSEDYEQTPEGSSEAEPETGVAADTDFGAESA